MRPHLSSIRHFTCPFFIEHGKLRNVPWCKENTDSMLHPSNPKLQASACLTNAGAHLAIQSKCLQMFELRQTFRKCSNSRSSNLTGPWGRQFDNAANANPTGIVTPTQHWNSASIVQDHARSRSANDMTLPWAMSNPTRCESSDCLLVC